MARLLRIVRWGLGVLLYSWFAAVRNAPRVKQQKAARRSQSSAR